MKRGFLKWFYISVQFVMLAVSIPKVATLFHAYDKETMGPLIGGVDMRSWLVGIAIDLTATFTTWAAMAKYDESRKRSALLAPGLIILVCTALSVVANYEDAATQAPQQYAAVSLFAHPALLINPVLISAPPVLVLLLILLVPSVLAQPRIKSPEEIKAEAAQQVALINSQAQVREAKVAANAKVRQAQLSGLADSVGVVAKRAGIAAQPPPKGHEVLPLPEPETAPDLPDEAPLDFQQSGVFELPSANVSRAMWNSMSLKQRVARSGIITVPEIAEVLGVSQARARELAKEVRSTDDEIPALPGRKGVNYQALIDALYEHRTASSLSQAQKLEKALGVRKRGKQAQVIQLEPSVVEDDAEEA